MAEAEAESNKECGNNQYYLIQDDKVTGEIKSVRGHSFSGTISKIEPNANSGYEVAIGNDLKFVISEAKPSDIFPKAIIIPNNFNEPNHGNVTFLSVTHTKDLS